MKNGLKYHGAVVPMVTPFTAQGALDEAALNRLVDSLVRGGVAGIFVLGTTGEGAHVPRELRRQLVELAVKRASKRSLIFAGLGDVRRADVAETNEFFRAGADAVVVHPPISEKVAPEHLQEWFLALLEKIKGPVLLYNMPMTTGVSIPLEAVEKLLGHPKFVSLKDSENNPARLEETMKRFGGKKDFSVFVGVGALMEKGLKLGADSIVPSVGNLIPGVCQQLCDAAPIHKEALQLFGVKFPGHTEIFTALTHTKRSCMMLYSDKITVSMATTHIGYHEMPGKLSVERMLNVIELTATTMKQLLRREPRIGVCGLNPHAGEHGLFGQREEEKFVEPAVKLARKKKINVEGPLVPDAVFTTGQRKKYDAIVTLYHDQGHIPFKMLAFDTGVNITLGLPIIRTSVDHGTAFDIAWQGMADATSLFSAIEVAAELASRKGREGRKGEK